MPDAGHIVTDAEVAAFLQPSAWPAAGSFQLLHTLMIQGVEAEVERATGRRFAVQAYADEVTIPDTVLQRARLTGEPVRLQVRHRPIREWTSLATLAGRDPSTGAAIAGGAFPRGAYRVDLETGVIEIPPPLDPLGWPVTMAPVGAALLASYSAGYDTPPADLKLLVLQILARLFQQQRNSRWGQTSSAADGVQNTYPDVAFTANEKSKLTRFKRVVTG